MVYTLYTLHLIIMTGGVKILRKKNRPPGSTNALAYKFLPPGSNSQTGRGHPPERTLGQNCCLPWVGQRQPPGAKQRGTYKFPPPGSDSQKRKIHPPGQICGIHPPGIIMRCRVCITYIFRDVLAMFCACSRDDLGMLYR